MAYSHISTLNHMHMAVCLGPIQLLQHMSTLEAVDTCLLNAPHIPLLILQPLYVNIDLHNDMP